MKVNFPAGLIAGVLFASLLVFASSGFSGPSTFAPTQPTGGIVQYTASQTATITSTTTTSSSATGAGISLAPAGNKTVSSISNANALTTLQSAAAASNSSPGRPPSSLALIAGEPVQSLLLFIPIALAAVIGFVLYRTSGSRD